MVMGEKRKTKKERNNQIQKIFKKNIKISYIIKA